MNDTELEARSLLGLAADAELTPAQSLNVQVVGALRVLLDTQSAKLHDGKSSVDPGRLLATVEALNRLMPPPSPPELSRDERYKHLTDAELTCLETIAGTMDNNPAYVGGRERLRQLIGNDPDFADAQAEKAERTKELAGLRAEITRLTEENSVLRQQAPTSEPVRTAQIVELLPPPPRQLPPPEPEQPIGSSAAGANQQNWRPPGHWTKSGQKQEPWRDFVVGPDSKRQWWGPV
jgi:hypothetical protein